MARILAAAFVADEQVSVNKLFDVALSGDRADQADREREHRTNDGHREAKSFS